MPRGNPEGIVRVAVRGGRLADALEEKVHSRRATQVHGHMMSTLPAIRRGRAPEALERRVIDGHGVSRSKHVAVELTSPLQVMHRYGDVIEHTDLQPAQLAHCA